MTTTTTDDTDDTYYPPLDDRARMDALRCIAAIAPTLQRINVGLGDASLSLLNDEDRDPAARRARELLSVARDEALRLKTALGIILDGINEATTPKYEADP